MAGWLQVLGVLHFGRQRPCLWGAGTHCKWIHYWDHETMDIWGCFSNGWMQCQVDATLPALSAYFFSRRGANLSWTTPWKFLSQHRVDSIVPATFSDVCRAKCKPYSLPDDANRMLFVWFMTPGKIPRDPQHWLWKFHQVRHPHSAPCHWTSWHQRGRCFFWGKNEWRSLLSGWVFSGLGWILATLGWDCMVLEGISWKDGWKARFVPAKWDSKSLPLSVVSFARDGRLQLRPR